MGVADQLGLTESADHALARAAESWPAWVCRDPRLGAVDGALGGLRRWLAHAPAAEADEVLHALAQLAAADGGDNVDAALVLAWTLLPGARTVARRLQSLSTRIDEVVASQLWMEVRTFPWRRLRKVAANIIANTRAGALIELGATPRVARVDPMWGRSVPVDPTGPFWTSRCQEVIADRDPAEELSSLLRWAVHHEVICEEDRALLLGVVEAATSLPASRASSTGGLATSNAGARHVAAQCGISPATLRRRLVSTTAALSSVRVPAPTSLSPRAEKGGRGPAPRMSAEPSMAAFGLRR